MISDHILWEKIKNSDIVDFEGKIRFLMTEYGTREPCNRFDVGNTIEFIVCDHLKNLGFHIKELPNEKRIDLIIDQIYRLSIKYSSTGDITLHNSNSCINSDLNFTDTLLLTPHYLYLLTEQNLKEIGIDIKNYLKNTGDSLKLKRALLAHLDKNNFLYRMNININVEKKHCKNKLCSKLFYEIFLIEYWKSHNYTI